MASILIVDDELVKLVGGVAEKASEVAAGKANPQTAAMRRATADPTTKEVTLQAREVKPEQVIPMDDDGFEDF